MDDRDEAAERDALRAEVERLRMEVKAAHRAVDQSCDACLCSLRARAERLEKALREILSLRADSQQEMRQRLQLTEQIARAALDREEKGDGKA
jgi:hypothetical protein